MDPIHISIPSAGLLYLTTLLLSYFQPLVLANHGSYSTSWDCPDDTSQCLSGDKHKTVSTSEADSSNYAACFAYQNASCCDANFTQQLATSDVTHIVDGDTIFNWTHCGSISETCEAKLIEIECFYRCSPLMIYFAGEFPGSLNRIPLCSSFCDDWFDACKDDLTCVSNWIFDWDYDENTGENICPVNSTCDSFTNVYGNSEELCNVLWGNSFQYYDDTTDPDGCLTPMSYEENILVVEEIFEDACEEEEIIYSTSWDCPSNTSQCLSGDKHKTVSSSEADASNYAACFDYRDASCCDAEFTQQLATSDVTHIVDGDVVFNWTHCGAISETCEAKLIEIECFYRCSPLMIYFAGDFPGSLNRIPLCSSFCDDWYDACKDDLTCVANWIFGWDYDEDTGENICPTESTCNKFEDVYDNSTELCNILWGTSFEYFDDKNGGCLTPNDYENNLQVVDNIFGTCNNEYSATWDCPDDTSQCLEGDKHKKVSSSEADSSNYAACFEYQEESCCDAEFTQQLATSDVTHIVDGDTIFNWTHCGSISETCEAKLIEIECFYRCSPLMIYFAGEFPGSLNRIPLCSTFCDDWYDACKDDLTCVDNWIFDWSYDENTGENICPEGSNCMSFEDIYKNSTQLCNVLWGNSFEYWDDSLGGCLTPGDYENNKDVVNKTIFAECEDNRGGGGGGNNGVDTGVVIGIFVFIAAVIVIAIGVGAWMNRKKDPKVEYDG